MTPHHVDSFGKYTAHLNQREMDLALAFVSILFDVLKESTSVSFQRGYTDDETFNAAGAAMAFMLHEHENTRKKFT